jgi:hypothetical protein
MANTLAPAVVCRTPRLQPHAWPLWRLGRHATPRTRSLASSWLRLAHMGHDTSRWQELCPSASFHTALYRYVRRRRAYEYATARKCAGLHSRGVAADGKPFGERVANGCVICAALTTMVIFSQSMVRSRSRPVVNEDRSSLLRSRLPVKQKPGSENDMDDVLYGLSGNDPRLWSQESVGFFHLRR